MPEKIMRQHLLQFLDTTGSEGWKRIGLGVTTGNIEMNANITTEQYIHEDTAYNSIDSYAPSMSIEQTAYKGDDVYDYIFDIYYNRKTGSDCESQMLNVYYKETSGGSSFKAEKQNVAIEITSYGGDAGAPVKINYTVHFNGDAVTGTATISNGVPTFTPTASV